MKDHRLFVATFAVLLYGSQFCTAQQEDTLKLPVLKPEFAAPALPLQSNRSLMPTQLGLDGLEYISSSPKNPDTLIKDLTVKNFLEIYYDDFLEWEEDTYGWNLNIHQFTKKNGQYLAPPKFVPWKKKVTDPVKESPYPLAHNINNERAAISIAINWKPTKHDIWFKELFNYDKRILYNGVSVAKFDYRDPIEFQRVQLVNTIIEQRKAETGGIIYNPDLSNLKRRIRQIRSNIKDSARLHRIPMLGNKP